MGSFFCFLQIYNAAKWADVCLIFHERRLTLISLAGLGLCWEGQRLCCLLLALNKAISTWPLLSSTRSPYQLDSSHTGTICWQNSQHALRRCNVLLITFRFQDYYIFYILYIVGFNMHNLSKTVYYFIAQ